MRIHRKNPKDKAMNEDLQGNGTPVPLIGRLVSRNLAEAEARRRMAEEAARKQAALRATAGYD